MTTPTSVVVHPLVLLSVVDHYNRIAKDTRKRVVGVLLGEVDKQTGQVDVTNSYAVPFDEDDRKQNIWFLDHNYHENMYAMFKKVNAREKVVGWYSTGPKIRTADLDIQQQVFSRYCKPDDHYYGGGGNQPVFVIVDVKPKELGIPTKAYKTIEEVSADGKEATMSFQHIPSEIGALEAEEVGVEHLLRDVRDASCGTLSTQINDKVRALKGLENHIVEMKDYLQQVVDKKLPLNHQIINQLQDIFNLVPSLSADELVRSFNAKNSDMMLVMYLSSMIRSVIALHNLINNKIANRDAEKEGDDAIKKEEEKEDEIELVKEIAKKKNDSTKKKEDK